ncbi:hypothetical protein FRX31_010799 [Thalictrum thalictroides]|uniref:BZIP domain-containing protein n=1 Tax=Thalictrum thalictroides TaxID=46969 RepID=A0A7J6WT19_THATH|nr:hypothetical protein FRX31_010799 [Thalictrum thalictroides]
MPKFRDRSSVDIEVHRLKNRLRQQRYRARKREENSKEAATTPLLASFLISSLPNVSELSLIMHDAGSLKRNIEPESGTGLTDCGHEDLGKFNRACSPIEAQTLQAKCQAKQEDQQLKPGKHQCNDEFLGTGAARDPYVSPSDSHTFTLDKICQPLLELEHDCVNTHTMECHSSEKSLDQREQSRIMARRLKNRERQRRYRARRRHEADLKKAQLVQNSTLLTLDLQTNEITINPVNRVHCQRKWKNDARRANASKEPGFKSTEPLSLVLDFAREHLTQISPSEVKVEQPAESKPQSEISVVLNDCETNKNTHARRDWKEDARNKID